MIFGTEGCGKWCSGGERAREKRMGSESWVCAWYWRDRGKDWELREPTQTRLIKFKKELSLPEKSSSMPDQHLLISLGGLYFKIPIIMNTPNPQKKKDKFCFWDYAIVILITIVFNTWLNFFSKLCGLISKLYFQ